LIHFPICRRATNPKISGTQILAISQFPPHVGPAWGAVTYTSRRAAAPWRRLVPAVAVAAAAAAAADNLITVHSWQGGADP
jgi:hypothetical protein